MNIDCEPAKIYHEHRGCKSEDVHDRPPPPEIEALAFWLPGDDKPGDKAKLP